MLPVLVLILSGLVALALAWWWCRRRRADELAARRRLRATHTTLRPDTDHWQRGDGSGQIAILAVGSYAARQLPSLLEAYRRVGAADHIGVIYLLDLDHQVRDTCLREVPPAFLPRVVTASCDLLSGGLIGRDLRAALSERPLWIADVMAGAHTWLARMERETRPVLVLALVSPGGMAALGRPVLDLLHERKAHLPIYLVTILDQKRAVRERFPDLLRYYRHGGLVKGAILMDNLRHSRRSDAGLAALLAAMAGAPWVDERPLELWNALSYLFPEHLPERTATVSIWAETLPVAYRPPACGGLPERFLTPTDLLVEKILRGVQTVLRRADLQALPLPAAPRSQLCYVVVPAIPEPDLRLVAGRVRESLELEGRPDVSLHFASMAAPLSGSPGVAPLLIALLQPVADLHDAGVTALARGTLAVDPAYLPPARAEDVFRAGEPALAAPEEVA